MRDKSSTFFDLLNALPETGCAVCRLVDRYTREHVDAFFYEQITSVPRRAEIRAARGFCSVHSAVIQAPARALGIAIVHQDVLANVLRDMNALAARSRIFGPAALAAAIRPAQECTLCAFERDREGHVLRTLVEWFGERELTEAYAASEGVCLPHFSAALGQGGIARTALNTFVRAQCEKITGLRDALELFVAKTNATGIIEPMGAEADAPRRALRMVSGGVVRTDGRR